jgi:hypothetical protein
MARRYQAGSAISRHDTFRVLSFSARHMAANNRWPTSLKPFWNALAALVVLLAGGAAIGALIYATIHLILALQAAFQLGTGY